MVMQDIGTDPRSLSSPLPTPVRSLRGLVVQGALEEQDMGLWLVDLVMLPPKALGDSHSPPFLFPQKLQRALGLVVVLGGNGLQHGLWELHVAVFELAVRVSSRIMDRIDE